MKDQKYFLNTALAVIFGTMLVICVLIRTFVPGFIIPELEQTDEIPVSLVLAGVKEFYIVTSLQTNKEALAAYEAEHPEVEPEPEPEPVTWEALASAIQEGVDSI